MAFSLLTDVPPDSASKLDLVHAADEARRQVGRDLHDGVQQRLVSLQQLLRLLEVQLGDAAPPLLAKIREEIAEANAELRELARGLHPVGLAEGGLPQAMEILAARGSVDVVVEGLPDRRLPDPIEITVFFLVSEALTNAARTARRRR